LPFAEIQLLLAVGSLTFSCEGEGRSWHQSHTRRTDPAGEAYALREQSEAYDGNLRSDVELLRLENTIYWNENVAAPETSLGNRH
jgi:hypothetical protein